MTVVDAAIGHAAVMHRSRAALAALVLIAGTTIGTVGASPAYAAPPDRWGFALVDDPLAPAWTNLNAPFQATSTASAVVQGGRVATGRFQVRFPKLGVGSRGIVHVTAVHKKGNYCAAVRWFVTAGPDEVVEVQCFAPGGTPADTPFTVLWDLNSTLVPSSAGTYASVHYGAAAGFAEIFNSTGAGVVVTPVGTGVAQVIFQKVAIAGSGRAGNLQVTAVSPTGAPRWCKVGSWDMAGPDVVANVSCFDAAGNLVDNDFTASYHRERSVLTVLGPPKFMGYVWSNASASTLGPQTNFNAVAGGYGANAVWYPFGDIEVQFVNLSVDEDTIQVTAIGPDPNYCTISKRWLVSTTDIYMHATCFDPAGNIVPEDAFITLTNRS
jgi:hypothetical protein